MTEETQESYYNPYGDGKSRQAEIVEEIAALYNVSPYQVSYFDRPRSDERSVYSEYIPYLHATLYFYVHL